MGSEAARGRKPTRGAQNPKPLDADYEAGHETGIDVGTGIDSTLNRSERRAGFSLDFSVGCAGCLSSAPLSRTLGFSSFMNRGHAVAL
jgi:hypothetical protein